MELVSVAAEIAQESKMEKRLGCVIVYKKHIIASSANRVVGTPRKYAKGPIYNVSMHSEMAAMEEMLKKHGLLQLAHSLLCCRRPSSLAMTTTRSRRKKKRFEKGC